MNGQCDKSLKMLLSLGIDDLHDDSFEGSPNEDTIFKDVFFGHENGRSSKKCLVTGAINFENDDNTPKNSSFPSTGEHSITTTQEDSGSLSEEFVSIKRRKVSFPEHSIPDVENIVNSETPSKETDSCLCQPSSIVTCRLVESSVHGVKSRCYLLKGHVSDKDATKCRLCCFNTNYPNDSPVDYFKKIPKDSCYLELDEKDDQDRKILPLSDTTSCQTINVDEDEDEDQDQDQESCRKLSFSSFEDENNKSESKFKRLKRRKGKPSEKRKTHVRNASKKYKNRMNSCRLLPRGNDGDHDLKENCFPIGVRTRTVLSWLIDSGVIQVNEVIEYRNPRDNFVIKHGLITRDGIQCGCCGNKFSVSKFKIHAGFTLNCPCLNLFMESGKSLTLCQLEAWSTEYNLRNGPTQTVNVQEIDQNDDSCGLCGDGGDLICCDNCPSTFHQECLCLQELPEGDWYCPNCSCWSCGKVVDIHKAKIKSVWKCLQCKHKYHKECVGKIEVGIGMEPSTWFCSKSCKEIHSGLDSRVGMMNSVSDGFSWTLLKCTHGDRNVLSDHHFVALKVEWNLKLAVALTIMEECFLPMIDPRTGINLIPHVLYNQGSEFARLDYEGFYTMVLEKDDMLLSIACLRIHGIGVAEMPLIATCNKYQRQGMCRRLMNAIEEMLKSLKIEKLVLCAIPSLVETWTKSFGFMHLEPQEKKYLRSINLMVFPGTIWLKKHIYKGEIQNTPMENVASSYRGFGFVENKIISIKGKGKESLQKDGEQEHDVKDKQHSRFERMSFEMVCGVK
ncbi:hypothetical protein Lser_V15G45397 [Lactuca serriola]